MKIKLLDLFSGIGGFALGLKKAGFEYEKHSFCEIDKYAIQTYQKHFKDACPIGDVSRAKGEDIGEVDIITFGFPCQDLSIAGKRKGLEGARSGLFFQATRLIRELKPSLFIFENVKGLFSASEGQAFERCLREIADIGLYECEWQLLNTNWFLPQNRERVYFIGHLRGSSFGKVFPIGENDRTSARSQAWNEPKTKLATTIATKEGSRKENNFVVADYRYDEGLRVRTAPIVPTLTCGDQDNEGLSGKIYIIPEGTKKGYAEIKEGDSVNLGFSNIKTRRGRVGKGIAQTLDTGMQQYTIVKKEVKATASITTENAHGTGFNVTPKQIMDIASTIGQIRRLTPTECERLQGFPDGWTKGISDTQRYKCCGNAVTVDVVEAIGKRLLKEKK